MYKLKKTLSLLLLLCILVNCLPIAASAGRPEQFVPDASINVDSSVDQFARDSRMHNDFQNGTNTVRQGAVDATALVPGSGTTPIKFHGDVLYTGKAWW